VWRYLRLFSHRRLSLPTLRTLYASQYLPPYARGYSFEVRSRATPFLPEHREVNWEALDEPCFRLLENAHSDPYVHGSASASSDPSNNLSAEPLPQHMTVQQLSDWLARIFADASKPSGSDDRPLSLHTKAVAMHTQGQHHATAHQVLNPTAEVGAQADVCTNTVHSRRALNFDGLPSGEWFCSCGNPSRLIHNPADTITDALFTVGEVPVFDALKAQLNVSGIRSRANLAGSMFLDAATRSLMAMRMAVQVRRYLWLLEEPTRAAGLATSIKLPNDGLDFIFDPQHVWLSPNPLDLSFAAFQILAPSFGRGRKVIYAHDEHITPPFRGFNRYVHLQVRLLLSLLSAADWIKNAFHCNILEAVGLEEDARLWHVAHNAINWLIYNLKNRLPRRAQIEEQPKPTHMPESEDAPLQEELHERADTALSRHLSSTSMLVDGKPN
jgi:hypothetical protein